MTASAAVPATMRKVFTGGKGNSPVVRAVPVPQPGEGELLVKVVAVAQNPSDWKANASKPAGLGLGVDFAGTVVARGPSAPSHFKEGDPISGFTFGNHHEDRGSMAEYLITDASLVWRIPEYKTFEEACTLNCSLWTAIQALFHTPRLALTLRPEGASRDNAPWVLVYSGATSVGQFAIQLARYAGYRVITTASPKNFDLVKKLGADVALDYRDDNVAAMIREATGDSLEYSFNTFTEEKAQQTCANAFGKQGGKLIVFPGVPDSSVRLRSDVQLQQTYLYTAFGVDLDLFPASPEDHQQMIEWMVKIPELWQERHIQPNTVQHWPGGLDAIADGLQHLKEGKVSAAKIVYTL